MKYIVKSKKLSKNVKLVTFSRFDTKCFRFGFRIYNTGKVPYLRVVFIEGLSKNKLPLYTYSGLIKNFKVLSEINFGE